MSTTCIVKTSLATWTSRVSRHARRAVVLGLLSAASTLSGAALAPASASAATPRIDLKVLLLGTSASEPNFQAWKAALTREGVPFDSIIASPGHAPITDSALANGSQEGKYEAIIVSVGDMIDCSSGQCVSNLATPEWTAIEHYEQAFNVRQVTADLSPGPSHGMNWPTVGGGPLDGTTGTLTSDGQALFPYLAATAPVTMASGTFGYKATPVSGSNFKTLLATGDGYALAGIYTHPDGVQELIETFDGNENQLQSQLLRHGIIAWMTRGVYLGDQRNYLLTHIDDNFLPDDVWSTTNHTTDYTPAAAIREGASDVAYAADWSAEHKFRIDQLFNGGGSQAYIDEHGPDPLVDAFKTYRNSFGWINHTWDHPNLDQGCANAAYIKAEITNNNAWAQSTLGLTLSSDPTAATGNDDPGALVTGEHSGLANLAPGNPGTVDPPIFDKASASAPGGHLAPATYTYAITDQFSPSGGESSASQTDVTVTAANSSVTLSWEAVCHASDYKLYREVASSGNWKLIASVNASSSDFSDAGPQPLSTVDTGAAGTSSSAPPATNTAVEAPYEQNTDLAGAFSGAGVTVFGADASKPYPSPATAIFPVGSPPDSRSAAGATFTDGSATAVPRYPTNIYYNAATEAQEVDEYNTLYGGSHTLGDIVDSIINGGGGMFQHMMGNDPRPHYFHQSNMIGGQSALYYSVMNSLLAEYDKYFQVPIEQPTMAQIAQLLTRQAAWQNNSQVGAYIEGNQVTVSNSGSAADVPMSGISSVGSSYGGTQSGWANVPAGDSVYTSEVTWPDPVTPPTSKVTSAPAFAKAGPVTVSYTASDTGGPGLKEVDLYMELPSQTTYTHVLSDTSGASSGSFDIWASQWGGDGTYRFYTLAIDNNGISEVTPADAEATTLVDTKAPTSSANGQTMSSTKALTIGYTASDDAGGSGLDHVDLYARGPGEAGYALVSSDSSGADKGSFSYAASGEGTYSFYTVATDKSGNVQTAATDPQLTTVVDITAPTSSAGALDAFTTSRSVTVPYTASDTGGSGLASVTLYAKGPGDNTYSSAASSDTSPNATGSFSYTAASDGAYSFYTIAVDKAGNVEVTPAQPEATTFVDASAPTSSASGPATSKTDVLTIPYTAADAGGSGIASLDLYVEKPGQDSYSKVDTLTSPESSGHFSYTASGEGEYSFYTIATDRAGNTEGAPTDPDGTTFVDTSAPTSDASAPATVTSGSIAVSYTASDGTGSGLASIDLYVEGPGQAGYAKAATDDHPGANGTFTYAPSDGNGTYSFYTVAADNAGNVQASPARPSASTDYEYQPPLSTSANFMLTNTPDTTNDTMTIVRGDDQTATIGRAFTTPLEVRIADEYGNPVQGVKVTFTAPASGSGASGTFGDEATTTATTDGDGHAIAPTLTADTTAGTYTVTTSASGVAQPASFSETNAADTSNASMTIVHGDSQTATVGGQFGDALQVRIADQHGNPVPGVAVTFTAPGAGASATFVASGCTSNSTTTCTVTTDAHGQASASALTANGVAGAYAVGATASSIASFVDFALTNAPGAAASVTVSAGTGQSTMVGTAFASPLVALVKDSYGNPVPGATVTFAAPSSGASGKFANGSTTMTATTGGDGKSTPSTFTANTTAGAYKVSGSVGGATPGNFDLTNTPGAATKLTFTTQPTSGANIQAEGTGSFSVSVAVQDANGNTESSDNSTAVTLKLDNNPASGVLSCANSGGTGPLTVSGGTATFTGCAITKVGTGYTLTATSSPTRTAPSNANAFNVTPGTATKLSFTQQPSNSTGGIAFATQPRVTVLDQNGNTVTGDTSQVTLAIGANPGSGTLACAAKTVAATAGVAAFSGCNIDKAANGYTLAATDGALSSATSSAFNITVGPAAKLAFTQQPNGAIAASAFATQPKVTVQDAGGNTVTTPASSVTLSIATNPSGGALTCTANPVTSSSGVATFSSCRLDKAGHGYALRASSGTLASATSTAFNVFAFSHASGSAIGKSVTTTASITLAANTSYIVFATKMTSSDTASVDSTGFSTKPTLTPINAQQDFTGGHNWAWYLTGGAGTGKITVTFNSSVGQAYLEVVAISGTSGPANPVVTANDGLATGTNSSTATAALTGAPSPSDAELVFWSATENDNGLTVPTNFASVDFQHASGGSDQVLGGAPATTSTLSFSMQHAGNWGTLALDINGS